MKRSLFGVILLLAVATSARAQGTPLPPSPYEFPIAGACTTCLVVGYVDGPMRNSTISLEGLANHTEGFGGWGLMCESGLAIDRMDIAVENDDAPGTFKPLGQPVGSLFAGVFFRPDVLAAFSASCPNTTAYSGWAFFPANLPLGAHRFILVLWKGPYHTNSVITLNVIARR